MAIITVDPAGFDSANIVQVDSDAMDNEAAIVEIEDWAAEHGFARVNESWLRQILRDGKRLFRGVCYRLTEEELQSSSSICETSAEALEHLPKTAHRRAADG